MDWIKFDVNDKSTYPPINEMVMIYDGGIMMASLENGTVLRQGTDGRWAYYSCMIFEEKFSCDSDDNTGCCPHEIQLKDVTHWMPQPEEPK
jgi:hypothetical protein